MAGLCFLYCGAGVDGNGVFPAAGAEVGDFVEGAGGEIERPEVPDVGDFPGGEIEGAGEAEAWSVGVGRPEIARAGAVDGAGPAPDGGPRLADGFDDVAGRGGLIGWGMTQPSLFSSR